MSTSDESTAVHADSTPTYDPEMPARVGDVHALEVRVAGLEGEIRGWRKEQRERMITLERTVRTILRGEGEDDPDTEEVVLRGLDVKSERIKAVVQIVKELAKAAASIFKTPGCLVGMVGICLFGAGFLVVAIPAGMAIDATWSDGVSITTAEARRKGQENEVRATNVDDDTDGERGTSDVDDG